MRILHEALGMRKKGHEVFFAVEKGGGLVFKARKEGFKVYEVLFKKIFWPITFFQLAAIFLFHRIDIVNTHSSSDSWLGGIVARLLRKAIIRTRHLSTSIRRGLNSVLLYDRLADFIVTTSTDAADIIIRQTKKTKENCQCIPTGINPLKITIDEEQKEQFRKKYAIGPEDLVVGTVCFMRSWKGIDDFIKAAKLMEKDLCVKWFIIGGGHGEKYQKQAEKLQLKNLYFTGHLSNPFSAIDCLDIFSLLSTAHEGVSQASLQAAYLQKPLITTPTGGLKEVCVHNTTGLIVAPFSPHQVAGAVMQLKENIQTRKEMGKRAKEHVEGSFLYEQMLEKMEKIYFLLRK